MVLVALFIGIAPLLELMAANFLFLPCIINL